MIDPEFLEMMPETITVAPVASRDGYGKRTTGTPVSIRARLMFETTRRLTQDGQEIVEAGRAICYGAYPSITAADVLTLPDGSQPAITGVDTVKDETGEDHHTVIRFGR